MQNLQSRSLCTGCFKSLGVLSRMKIYNILKDGKRVSVTQIADMVGLKQPTVTYHLKEMEKAGLLSKMKKGKKVFYGPVGTCPNYNQDCVLNKIKFPGSK